ncbi:tail fiber protein [Pasteurellaceae bacterium HPA106]|uniref:phage tail protein n=1 Tax=Spirabiliibacterium pneumoniae TaxID=221400 RepID=UPI001AAD4DA4|nr:phage tail protein [Spirabiliibacterium pneumoniae]MBE2895446.1 tail fiber protein [Spirabiliibacterium pneumoniae]
MKTLLPKIDSEDGQFHDGDPSQGTLGTRVTAKWLNDNQERLLDLYHELHYLLSQAGLSPIPSNTTQVYQAIVNVINANRRNGSTSQKGEIQLTDSINMVSSVFGASALAVKTVNDNANRKLPLNGGGTVIGEVKIENNGWGRLYAPIKGGGEWRWEVNPNSENDTRFNYVYKTKRGESRHIAFPAITGNEKIAYQSYVDSSINRMFPVGHLLLTINPSNPSTYGYPGRWELIEDDVTLYSASSGRANKTPTGTNSPSVPLPQHSHSASIGSTNLGTKYTNTTGAHTHSGWHWAGNSGQGGQQGTYGTYKNMWKFPIYTNSSGNHSHSVDIGSHGHSVSISNAGSNNAALNVRGRYIKVYMWLRIS